MSEDKKIVRVSDAYIIDKTARRNLITWLLGFLLAFFIGGFILFSMFVYQTNNTLTKEDIVPLENYSSQLTTILNQTNNSQDAKANNVAAKLKAKNDELVGLISTLRKQEAEKALPQEELLKKLDDITLNLAIIQTELNADKSLATEKILKINEQIKFLQEKTASKTSIEKTIMAILSFLGNILVALIYPLIILAIILFFIFSRTASFRLNQWLGRFKSVKVFSTEFVLNEETKFRAEETLDVYRKQVKGEYDLWVQRKNVNQILSNVLKKVVGLIDETRKLGGKNELEDYRCTVHVPDLLFADTFYQLLDYYPHAPANAKTSGRTWSIRFGIIGKVWRSGKSEIRGMVDTDKEILIQRWGMTGDEADRAGKGRQSFICVLLKHEGIEVGMFYMDSKEREAFPGIIENGLATKVQERLNKLFEEKLKEKLEGDAELKRKIETDTRLKQQTEELLRQDIATENKLKFETELKQEALKQKISDYCVQENLTEVLGKINEDLGGRAPLIRVYNEY